MEFTTIEFKLDVQTLLYSNLHFDWSIGIWFSADICNNEFLLLSYSVVIPVDDNVDVIAQSNYDAVVAFKLLFDPVELEIILNAI